MSAAAAVKKAGFLESIGISLPGLAEPPTELDSPPLAPPGMATPKWNSKVSLDGLRDRMDLARRQMGKTEVQAAQARDAAEAARDAFEVARDDRLAAIEALNLFPTDPKEEPKT